MTSFHHIASAEHFREAARARLPRFLFDYAQGGAFSETTMHRNAAALDALTLRQRVLHDVGSTDMRTTLFGHRLPMPVILGPIGMAGMYHRRGEVQAARAAHQHGLPFTLSTVSICSMAEVRRGAPDGALWFQLYVMRDRGFMRELIAQAREGGADALVFTVDMPVPGIRFRDARSGIAGPWGPLSRVVQAMGRPRWAWQVGINGRPHRLGNLDSLLGKNSGMKDYMGWLASNFDPSIVWRDIGWIREEWDGPLIIKGILDAADAREAADLGADGIVVSNHGGRQLDGTLSTAEALPDVVDAVGDRLTVLADSGIRSGLDVLRMLALGAQGVLIGRSWLYALSAGGEAGVRHMLDLTRRELQNVMTLTGLGSVDAAGAHLLASDANLSLKSSRILK